MNKKRLAISDLTGHLQPQQRMANRYEGSQFEELNATSLYCPKCRVATPVKERLLLVLPGGGNHSDYMCTQCGESVGTKES